jgi:hypothetical protein
MIHRAVGDDLLERVKLKAMEMPRPKKTIQIDQGDEMEREW